MRELGTVPGVGPAPIEYDPGETGEGLDASHQTGRTVPVANLIKGRCNR